MTAGESGTLPALGQEHRQRGPPGDERPLSPNSGSQAAAGDPCSPHRRPGWRARVPVSLNWWQREARSVPWRSVIMVAAAVDGCPRASNPAWLAPARCPEEDAPSLPAPASQAQHPGHVRGDHSGESIVNTPSWACGAWPPQGPVLGPARCPLPSPLGERFHWGALLV